MKRRESIALVSGAAVVWPLAGRAQQPTIPLRSAPLCAVEFPQRLKEAGVVERQNVAIEYRSAGN